ncbi:MAG: hypothetical protein KDE50_15135, partial [Caldilineaceae bacterium]|nr:hypothetical protein [Caldilineaceae bacterium]
DTIVPDGINLFDWNRYMYVRGRPLNANDPSGHYSNEEIMQHFGCDSWSCVESNFNEGGALEGSWGWLNVLQDAQDGDSVTSTMLASVKGHLGSINSTLMGRIQRNAAGRIGVNLDTYVGTDYQRHSVEGLIDSDAFAQFASSGDVGMYEVNGKGYTHASQAACYTEMQCATQTLDAVATGSSAVAVVCLSSVVGAPCAGVASQVSLYAGIAGTGLTAYNAYRGDASALDVGVGMVTTTIGGVFGPTGKGAMGFTSSLFQWWWDQGD